MIGLALLVLSCGGYYYLYGRDNSDAATDSNTLVDANGKTADDLSLRVTDAVPINDGASASTGSPIARAPGNTSPSATPRVLTPRGTTGGTTGASSGPSSINTSSRPPVTPGATAADSVAPRRNTTPAPTRTPAIKAAPSPTPASNPVVVDHEAASLKTSAAVREQFIKGWDMLSEGKHIEGRALLSNLLTEHRLSLSASDAKQIRDALTLVNKHLVFSDFVHPKDPLVSKRIVASGENYQVIARRHHVSAKLLEMVNGIPARRLPAGRAIKVIRGPFHAEVDKSGYRLDLFLQGAAGEKLYVRSFIVGLGAEDSTPVGSWIVKPRSKTVNPSWRNPRDGKYYDRNDPENPIGEYWLGLEGTDENTSKRQSYGIHGTTDPDSIGKQRSMGCIRMGDKDVELIFHLLMEGKSTVVIRP